MKEESAHTAENAKQTTLYTHGHRLYIGCKKRDHVVSVFLIAIAALTLISLIYLQVPWGKLASRLGELGNFFLRLLKFNFEKTPLILTNLCETFCVTLLSTFYSLLLGIVFGMLAARNVLRCAPLSMFVRCFFTFLRAVPTTVWVLLVMVCLGFGPAAGIVGLCVHTTAFFTKSFAESFEDISTDTLEALEATGVGRIGVFLHAVLPSSLSQIVSWIGMRIETNFSESAILGMVGAGGIGYVISACIKSYDYGSAGLSIFLVFLLAYAIERAFVRMKQIIR